MEKGYHTEKKEICELLHQKASSLSQMCCCQDEGKEDAELHC